ncbi:MAG: hypothetical protein B7Y56_03200 [Gallionellales bacterium 35-53-114]|jgi:hypothetical protein|nr:MAG: hypothetical protein B7Y56_03200 [Gallionellales bacterium 35-53-114]OYZ65113.1 MAG: hypothetical protein B7Y04_00360 [Gallionellales bacterium 24-53-125]OZB08021.1 MAG: hypothetical protein B7X61_10810 [Gallionellales bacterium 39-52-133]HQS59767.1 hypothetical protein [Gallionellaceae bacterium]HQS76521.1 hypothetical protein [Gallionellaceae bacterium]
MNFNINHTVRVQLTDNGRALHKEEHLNFWGNSGHPKAPEYVPPKEDIQGWSEWQLWVLMEAFGSYMQLGFDLPFNPTIELVPDESMNNEDQRLVLGEDDKLILVYKQDLSAEQIAHLKTSLDNQNIRAAIIVGCDQAYIQRNPATIYAENLGGKTLSSPQPAAQANDLGAMGAGETTPASSPAGQNQIKSEDECR